MRGMEVVMIAGLLGLVAAGVWMWGGRRLPEWNSSTVPVIATAGVAGKPDTKLVRAPGKHDIDKPSRSTVMSDFKIGGFPASKTEVDVPISASPFPNRNDLRPGATGVQIRAKFGEPIARVTAMQGGQLLERYYYVNSDRTKLTMATLEHGVVVSAEAIPR
jgi:hypothetical protein